MPITLERIPHDKQVAVYALSASGYASRKIASTVELSQPTVLRILHEIPSNLSEVELTKKALVARQYAISQRACNYITDDKLDKMNALQLMTINAIGIDKARDMEGSNRPVFNIVNVVGELRRDRAQSTARIEALLALKSERDNVVS